jgi:hypothetical protein
MISLLSQYFLAFLAVLISLILLICSQLLATHIDVLGLPKIKAAGSLMKREKKACGVRG